MIKLPACMLIFANLVSFSALNDLYMVTLRSYDLENIIFEFPIPENPHEDARNSLIA